MSDMSTSGAGRSGSVYDAVFTDKKDNSTMTQEDFLKIMVAQLTNQQRYGQFDGTVFQYAGYAGYAGFF